MFADKQTADVETQIETSRPVNTLRWNF